MKIENPNVNTVKLESIEQGKCFKAEDNGIYMATDERDSESKEVMCVNLDMGVCVLFAADEEVIPITAKVVIEA